jgi:4'-phosphopantetheinyl transferase
LSPRRLELRHIHSRLEWGAAHLWLMDLTLVDEPALEDCRILLSEEELQRAQRFRFESDRRAYLVSHGLLRKALSWAEPSVSPEDWVFARTPMGRPEVDRPEVIPRLRFNISHTNGLVACVITSDMDCGVDVEDMTARSDIEPLSRRILAASERAYIAALPEEERLCGFFRLWTLKEAYTKARGLGFSLPFEQLRLSWHEDAIRLDIDPSLDDGGHWHLEQWQATPDVMLSVALRRGQQAFRGLIRHSSMPCGLGPRMEISFAERTLS